MTDEMTIQQRKSPVMPTVVGAGVGALGGLGVSAAYNKITDAKSYEELVAEVKDKTDFSSKKEPAKWSDLKKKTEEIVKLEKELKELPEKVLEESDPAAKARKSAQEAYDKELKRMIEAEEKSLGVDTGKKFVVGDAGRQVDRIEHELSYEEKRLLKTELDSYKKALEKLNGKPENASHLLHSEYQAIETAKNEAKDMLSGAKSSKVFKTSFEAYADKVLPKRIADIKSLYSSGTASQQLANYERLASEFGDVFTIHDVENYATKNGNKPIKITNAYGSGKHAWVEVDMNALKEARKTLIEGYAESGKRYKELTKELSTIQKDFFKANQTELANHGIATEADLKTFVEKEFSKTKKKLKWFEENIDNAIRNGESEVKNPISGKKLAIADAEAELEKLSSKIDFMNNYAEQASKVNAEQQKLIMQCQGVKDAQAKYVKAMNTHSSLETAVNSIKRKLTGRRAPEGGPELWAKLEPMLKAEGGSVSHSVDEAKLKEILDNNKYGKDLKAAIEKYEKALSEKGVANTAAREAKQGALNKVKGEAQKIAEGLAGKKMGAGMAAAIGAGIVGVTTLLVVNSKNKNA